jgi:hypothetical protein
MVDRDANYAVTLGERTVRRFFLLPLLSFFSAFVHLPNEDAGRVTLPQK